MQALIQARSLTQPSRDAISRTRLPESVRRIVVVLIQPTQYDDRGFPRSRHQRQQNLAHRGLERVEAGTERGAEDAAAHPHCKHRGRRWSDVAACAQVLPTVTP